MGTEAALQRMEATIQEIHGTVIRIEHDHGAKIEALFDGFDAVNQRLDRLETGQQRLERNYTKLELGQAKLELGQAKLEQGQAAMREEINKINHTLARVVPVLDEHDARIRSVEKNTLREHLEEHD